VPYYEYDDERFFRADDAPAHIGEQRRAAFRRLTDLYRKRFARTVRQTNEVQDEISDLQFTARYRVPFQFSRFVRQQLNSGSFVVSSSGRTTTDLDGNRRYEPGRLLRRECIWLRLLQGMHRTRQRTGARPGPSARRVPSGDGR